MHLVSSKDDILKKDCAVFDFNNPTYDLNDILPKMKQIMIDNDGVGLAAPQVGIDARIFIIKFRETDQVYINPEIVAHNTKQLSDSEGCLSFPDLQIKIKRSSSVQVKYYDENNTPHEIELSGHLARIFQHEYDHTRGITFDTKVSKMKLDMAKRKLKKRKVY